MRYILLLFVISSISWISCNSVSSEIADSKNDSYIKKPAIEIDRDSILKIAEKDAKKAYRDLSIYNVSAEMKDSVWYVDYNLSDPNMVGGGPHYVICAKSGTILTRRYEQ